MRVRLSKKDRQRLFLALKESGKNSKSITAIHHISARTLNDWRCGLTTIPLIAFSHLVAIASLDLDDFSPKFLPDLWHIREAGRKGAQARMKQHGNFGTVEGRRRGGINSLKTHQQRNTGFKILKPVYSPRPSEKLAELIGILVGDGHLSPYQVSITTNSKTDKAHARFVQKLIGDIFGIHPTIKNKNNENTINIVASSKNLVLLFHRLGMPIGNKLKKGLFVPPWIMRIRSYQKAFIRGLFDTDGCIYKDTHRIHGKEYTHLGWTITSYADTLIKGVLRILQDLGFTPTFRSSQKSVYLRRQNQIKRYFKIIGTHNPKHFRRFEMFTKAAGKLR